MILDTISKYKIFLDIDKKNMHYKKIIKQKDISILLAWEFNKDTWCIVKYKINTKDIIWYIIRIDWKINKKRLSYLNSCWLLPTHIVAWNWWYDFVYLYSEKSSSLIWWIYTTAAQKRIFSYIADFLWWTVTDTWYVDWFNNVEIIRPWEYLDASIVISLNDFVNNTLVKITSNAKDIFKHVDAESLLAVDITALLSQIKWYTYKWSVVNFTIEDNVVYAKCNTDTQIWYIKWDTIYYLWKEPLDSRLLPVWRVNEIIYSLMWIRLSAYQELLEGLWLTDKLQENEDVYFTYAKWDYSVLFTVRWVFIETNAWKKSFTKNIIRAPIKIIWKGTTEIKWGMYSNVIKTDVFIVSVYWEEMLIEFIPSKREWNKRNWDRIFFYWDDNDMWIFFEAMEQFEWTINVKTENGIYEEYVWLWSEIIINKSKKDIHLISKYQYNIVTDNAISYKEMFDKMLPLYDEQTMIPILLQAFACAWMNTRSFTDIRPWLFITWWSKSWKTTISDIMKHSFWYWEWARATAAPLLTRQPLLVDACDKWILFIDEITSSISPKAEQALRALLNDKTWKIWSLWTNLSFDVASNLILTWERTLIEESINNRLVIIDLWEHEKRNDKLGIKYINDLFNYTIAHSIYWKYMEVRWDMKAVHAKYYTELFKMFWREWKIRSTIFVVNELLWLWIDNNKLLEYTKYHLSVWWFYDEEKKDKTLEEKFWDLLAVSIYRWDIIYRMYDSWWKEAHEFLFIKWDFYQTNRFIINRVVTWIKEKYAWLDISSSSSSIRVRLNMTNCNKWEYAFKIFLDEEFTPRFSHKIVA